MNLEDHLEYLIDEEEVSAAYQEIAEYELTVSETIEAYNTMIAVAQLLAEDMEFPYSSQLYQPAYR